MNLVMYNGYQPPPRAAVVLASGPDSVAAAHWAAEHYAPVVLLWFDYGQERAEGDAIHEIVERANDPKRGAPRGWRFERRIVTDIGQRSPEAGLDAAGVSRANVPGRNGILVWHAANVAARLFPGGRVALVVGCNLDDAAGFDDCRAEFLDGLRKNVRAGFARSCDITLDAPWAPWLCEGRTKEDIIHWCANRPEALADVRYAVSCYRGTRCGTCDACTKRAAAFAAAAIEDGTEGPPAIHGGDPAREPRRA